MKTKIVYPLVRIVILLISRLAGYVLILLGKLFGRLHVEFLGHYLSGMGGVKTIPSRYHTVLLKRYDDMKSPHRRLPKFMTINNWDKNVIVRRRLETLYNAVGKIRIKKIGNMLVFIDYYKFYPMQDVGLAWYEQENQGAKFWQNVPLLNIIHPLLTKLPEHFRIVKEITLPPVFPAWEYPSTIYFQLNRHRFSLEAKDSLFAPLGREFISHARVMIPDEGRC